MMGTVAMGQIQNQTGGGPGFGDGGPGGPDTQVGFGNAGAIPGQAARAPVPDRVFPEAGRAAVDLAEEKAPSSFSAAAAAARRRAEALKGRHRESMRLWGRSA